MMDYFIFFMWCLFGISAAVAQTDRSWPQVIGKSLALIFIAFMMAWNFWKIAG